jgi:hypothetical protein
MPKCARLSDGIQKENPAASSVQAICGNVKRSNVRLPYVSIVQIAGQAKIKLTKPKPQEARSDSVTDAPACEKTVEE